MTENVRKRVSKWDLASETHFPPETGEMGVQLAIARETSGDETKMDLKSLEDSGTEYLKWSGAEENKKCSKMELEAENDTFMNSGTDGLHVSKWSDIKTDAKDCLKGSDCQPASRSDEWKDIDVSRENTRFDANHDQSMSPNIDARHQQNSSISAKGGWNRSHRSRSRSRSRSRDNDMEIRDRGREWGWGMNRSRSRSPVQGFKGGGGAWDQTGKGAPCRDFVTGRCKRGGECRYLHEDGGRRFSSRQHDAAELGGSRDERGQSPGYHIREQTTDSMGQRDYPHENAPPGHSSHYGGDWRKPEPHKSGKYNAICHDFRRGRCQRGSACRYMHHDTSSDGGCDGKGWPRDRFQHGGDIKESAFSDRRPELHRASDTPCKFFAEGRCRNGEKCRFSHKLVQSQPDGRSCDLKSVQNSDNQNRMPWNGPTWDNQDGSMAVTNAPAWQRDDSSSKVAPYATVVGLESDPNRHNQQLKHADAGKDFVVLPMDVSQRDLPAQDQSSSQETSSRHEHVSEFSALPVSQSVFGQQHAGVDRIDGSPRGNDSIVINTSITKNEASKLSHEEETISISNSISPKEAAFVNLPANPAVIGQSSNLIGHNQYVIPQPRNAQSFDLAGQSQQVVTPSHFDGQNQSLLLNGQTRVVVPQNAPNMHHIPPPFFNVQTPQSHYLLPSNQQCQLVSRQPPQNVNHNMKTQSQGNPPQSMGLDNQAQVGREGQLQGAENDATKPSQRTSDAITSRGVTSEPVAQLSNLPASLSLMFGNGPQLPQLYAALNPQHGAGVPQTFSHPGSVGSFASTAVTHIQPNQGSWTQQQHGPASNSTDLSKVEISNNPLGFPSDTCAERSTAVGESQSLSKTIAPLLSTDGTMKTVGSESNPETKQVDANGDNGSKEKVTVTHPKDPNGDVQADEASKPNKDAKGSRLFRFALVEFVKDILRPTWKEGQMSKEAHKTIVKKVVDKVTGTLDGNIPQTQERIDLYLSYSKEKLTKLVQAYTEKYLKT